MVIDLVSLADVPKENEFAWMVTRLPVRTCARHGAGNTGNAQAARQQHHYSQTSRHRTTHRTNTTYAIAGAAQPAEHQGTVRQSLANASQTPLAGKTGRQFDTHPDDAQQQGHGRGTRTTSTCNTHWRTGLIVLFAQPSQ